MSSLTHRKKIARHLATLAAVPYQQALAAVTAAANAGVLPTHLPGGLDAHLDTAARVARGWLPTPGTPTPSAAADLDPAAAGFRHPTHPATAGGLVIGTTATGTPVWLTERQLSCHGVLFGAPGPDRARALGALADGLLALGWAGTILDAHPDAGGELRAWAGRRGAAMPHPRVDPFAGLDHDESCILVLSLVGLNDVYWRAAERAVLRPLIDAIGGAHQVAPDTFPPLSLNELARMLSAESLPQATAPARAALTEGDTAVPDLVAAHFRALTTPSRDEAAAAATLGEKLTRLLAAPGARTVLAPAGGSDAVDVTGAGLTYLGLGSGDAAAATLLSATALIRSTSYASRLTRGIAPRVSTLPRRFLIVDNASQVNRQLLLDLLAYGRAAGLAVFLADQGPAAWHRDGSFDWDRVRHNAAVTIALRTPDITEATILAGHLDRVAGARTTPTADLLRTLPAREALVAVDRRLSRCRLTPAD